jgi:4-hydroxy-2-oxoheptanedioate aldolase
MSTAETFAALSRSIGGGSGLLTGWVGLPDPLIAGLVAREDVDAVTLDMQHGSVTIGSAVQGIGQVLLGGKPAIVRIPVGEFQTASRMLDVGASGIIAPMINTVADARLLAAYTKFPPVGERSWGPALALNVSGLAMQDYLERANALTVAIAMVETRESLAILDDILAVPGIDGVFVGPSDLSIALSSPPVLDAGSKAVDDMLDHVLKRCRAHGKAACMFATTGARAKQMRARGYDLIAIGNDVQQIRLGVKTMVDQARA